MALNVTESTAVNSLIDWITGTPDGVGSPVDRNDALAAAELLARSANKRLMAGWRGDGDVERAWPREGEDA